MTDEFFVHERPDGRWIIINALDTLFAWSGSRWVTHDQGYPLQIQISNFDSAELARINAFAAMLGPERT
jgi:hypothetical protein